MRQWTCRSEQETEALGRRLARELAPDGILLLEGDLGVGKTVLTRGLGAGLGLTPSDIQSPTFTLVREHETDEERLIHVDLYRLDAQEAVGLGLEELLCGPGVKVVEWADRISFPVCGAVRLLIERHPDGDRQVHELGSC